MIAVPSKGRSIPVIINSLAFIVLNMVDAWLTREHLAIGNYEGNPLVAGYGSVVWFKGLLALVILIVLLGLGKTKLLWILNMFMLAVVLWNAGWLLYFQ
ncbi:unnamed protein product [marine sediment metagenome]|uniref:DUF5658 domain-containing protein n=1 Tax=marine sediment metagenome TaxID=412755 RepID=X1SAK7_9ZZZZ